MLTDEIGRHLHDKATRGKSLTSEEHILLEKWYDENDSAESESLNLNVDLKTEHTLQKQIDLILIKIEAATGHIQKLTNENRLLRNDITNLHKQLSERTMAQAI